MNRPQTRFARTASGSVAYQVVGGGPMTMLVNKAYMFPIDLMWEEPAFCRFLEGLSSCCRSIWFDQRGVGSSDATEAIEGRLLESGVGDMVAVLDDLEIERSVVFGFVPGSLLFAAAHPERVEKLVLYNVSARYAQDEGYEGYTHEEIEQRLEKSRDPSFEYFPAPSLSGNDRFAEWYARGVRLSAGPEHRRWRLRMTYAADQRAILGSIQAPSLVMQRGGTSLQRAQRDFVATHIPGAESVTLPGDDDLFFAGDPAPLLDAIASFITTGPGFVETDRVLATVMFTDIVDSTPHAVRIRDQRWRELLSAHDRAVRAELERFKGRAVKSMGDGVLATFDGPGRALRCATAIRDAVSSLGIELRIGLHTAEIEQRGDDIGGIAVHIAQRIEANAAPNEILVSRTVVDLVAGSGLEFLDRGSHSLKGVPGEWPLFAFST